MNNELNNDEAFAKDDEAFDNLNVGHLWLAKYLFVIMFTTCGKKTKWFWNNCPRIYARILVFLFRREIVLVQLVTKGPPQREEYFAQGLNKSRSIFHWDMTH